MCCINIKKLVLGNVSTNCYVVANTETKEAIVIDPADQASRISDVIKEENVELKAILLTHGHFDHVTAATELASQYHCPIYCHEAEQEILEDSHMNLSSMMGQYGDITLSASNLLHDNEQMEVAHFKIKVLYTPGHTKGGVCYYFVDEDCIFVGDTIFLESVGRTDFPTGNAATLIKSIQDKLYVLDDKIKLYPGHGPATSIGYEKENNPYTSQEVFWN